MINVLIVEDDPMVSKINKTYTERIEGFKVVGICKNGKEALETLKVKKVDLVILDLYMPRMDGIEFLRQMRREDLGIDIIMVTAASEANKLDEVLKFGVIDYLIKPFEYDRFKEALDRFLLKYNFFKEQKTINQEDVDKFTRRNIIDGNKFIQKGLQKKTLEKIRAFIKENGDRQHTSEEIAEATELSRVTIRRYMNYMVKLEEITSEIDYETGGRPSIKYRWNNK